MRWLSEVRGGLRSIVGGGGHRLQRTLLPNYLPGVQKGPVVFLGLAVAFSLLGDVTLYVVLPVYHGALGLSPVQVGILLSANRWVRLLTNDWARRIIDRRRPEHVFAAVLATGAAATALYASSPPFLIFLAARLLWGASWSFIRHLGVMTVLSVAPRADSAAARRLLSPGRTAPHRPAPTGGHSGGVLGLYNAVVQVGFIGGTITGGLLFDRFGFGPAFGVMALVSLTALIFDYAGFALLRSAQAQPGGTASGPVATPAHLHSARPAPRPAAAPTTAHTTAHTTARPSYLLLLRGFVVTCVGTGLIVSTLGFALQSRLGPSIYAGGVLIGVTTITALVIAAHYLIQSMGSLPLGLMVDRLGFRRAENYAFAIGAIALGGAAWFPEYRFLLPAVVVFFIVTVMAKLALVARAGLGGSVSFSRFMTAADLGAAVGPIVGWVTIAQLNSADAVFAFGAVLYLLAAVAGSGSRGTAVLTENPGSKDIASQGEGSWQD